MQGTHLSTLHQTCRRGTGWFNLRPYRSMFHTRFTLICIFVDISTTKNYPNLWEASFWVFAIGWGWDRSSAAILRFHLLFFRSNDGHMLGMYDRRKVSKSLLWLFVESNAFGSDATDNWLAIFNGNCEWKLYSEHFAWDARSVPAIQSQHNLQRQSEHHTGHYPRHYPQHWFEHGYWS